MIAFGNVMLVQMWCRHTCGVQLHWEKLGIMAFRNVMLVDGQMNSSVTRQVGQCASWKVRNVAGMGQCASLKGRKRECESLCFHSKSECTGLRKLVV